MKLIIWKEEAYIPLLYKRLYLDRSLILQLHGKPLLAGGPGPAPQPWQQTNLQKSTIYHITLFQIRGVL